MTANGSLSPKQRRFVDAVISSPTIKSAASVAGISERTAFRYLEEPAVRSALAQAQDTAFAQVTRQVVSAMTEALDTLKAIMADSACPAMSRVHAARAVLESALRLNQAVALIDRVTELERANSEA